MGRNFVPRVRSYFEPSVMPKTQRLPWRVNSESGGFIAYPDGEEHADRFAVIARSSSSGTLETWLWRARYGEAVRYGTAHSKQEAADEVTAVWPSMSEAAAVLEAEAQARDQWLKHIQASIDDGNAGRLNVAGADTQMLVAANWHLRQELERQLAARAPTNKIESVMAVISAELFARRRSRDDAR